jgi:hypothetical protein
MFHHRYLLLASLDQGITVFGKACASDLQQISLSLPVNPKLNEGKIVQLSEVIFACDESQLDSTIGGY